ncbi:MAG: ATP-dependent DNA helicase RecG [Lachnospiraceae bacterium]|nr:ATP-dependent DNA helicase RecG [Lachnospiraceae bacterium]
MELTSPVTAIPGIGKKSAEEWAGAGIRTVEDVMLAFPSSYERLPQIREMDALEEGERAAVRGTVMTAPLLRRSGKSTSLSMRVSDGSASLTAVFFNMPYLKNSLVKGRESVFFGRVAAGKQGGLLLVQPKLFTEAQYAAISGTIRPVYPAGALTQKKTEKAVAAAFDAGLVLPDPLTAGLCRPLSGEAQALSRTQAARAMHFPASEAQLRAARERLAYEEFLTFFLSIRLGKEHLPEANACPMPRQEAVRSLIARLPYTLTGAQQRAAEEILADLKGSRPMHRLIQGDVGSGKTILAVTALVCAWENGFQGALMAPTELLAHQHHEKITALFSRLGLPIRCELLTGSATETEKRFARARIAAGVADLVIGTHALIQEAVSFARLGLVVTDEQHRFGVRQRETLGAKGECPHMLVMSATPIPRTLAMILYADLDVSVLRERPAGRQPVQSAVITPRQRAAAFRLMQREIDAGRQVYIICPLVEAGETSDAENVTDYTEKLREVFPPSVRIASLHGRMRPEEKNARMEAFLHRETDILVSTTVVEVGVDVPNATVMMIENSERFGLAQLHQLRGRIGRGTSPSWCLFVDASGKKKKNERLAVLERSSDGFEIAEEDLRLRGPGELLGVRQSGAMEFEIGDIYTDHSLLLLASEQAGRLLSRDPGLNAPEHALLKETVLKKQPRD